MRARLTLIAIVIAVLFAPAPASAVTISDIVALSKAGVSEAVIVALITRDKTIFTMSAEEMLALKKEGVGETVLIAMLRSGRDDVPPPAPVEIYPPQEPNIVVFGTGPDHPNVPPYDGTPYYRNGYYYTAPPYAAPSYAYPVPYVVPVPVVVPVRSRRFHRSGDVIVQPFLGRVPQELPHQQFDVPGPPTQAPVPQPRTFEPTQGIFFQGTPRGIFFNR